MCRSNGFPSQRLMLACALLALLFSGPRGLAQGCVSARFIYLSLGPDGIIQLPEGTWQLSTSFRYLYADQGWMGTHAWPQYSTVVGNQITVYSVDLQLTRAITDRWSATLTLPYLDGMTSNPREHDGTRHSVSARGIGDIRIVANYWLLAPADHPNGNISLGFGLKLPTGQEAATAIFYKPGGPRNLPVDISIQPGDGGWGIMLETSLFRRLAENWHAYGTGFYLINPRELNKAFNHNPILGSIRNHSVPDQYQVRAGLAWTALPAQGMTFSAGLRVEGMPSEDLIGGNEGFRRPGYVIYAEPGFSWSKGNYSFNLFFPIRLDANRTRNFYDKQSNTDGGGAFAQNLLVTSFSRRF